MLSYWVALLILLGGMWFEADSALAHDPDTPELEVPEVTVIRGARSRHHPNNSFQTKKFCCSRKADRLRCCG